MIADGGMLVCDGLVVATGTSGEIARALPADAEIVDAGGRVVLPGFVDAHTHPVFAGNRVDEFEMRARGATYEEIAAAGGGIRSTVRKTRAATEAELEERDAASCAAIPRVRHDGLGGEVGLRPHPRGRIEDAAGDPGSRRGAGDRDGADVSRRACDSAGVCGRAGALRAACHRRDVAACRGGRAGGVLRHLLRARLFRYRNGEAHSDRREAARPEVADARRPADELAVAPRWRRSWVRRPRITSSRRKTTGSRR